MRSNALLLFASVSVVLVVFFCESQQHEDRLDDVNSIVQAYERSQDEWPAPHLSEGVPHRPLALLPDAAYPEKNPHSEAKEQLGKRLFFDPRLSASGTLACASCHDPDLGWTDGRRRSVGHAGQQGKRNSMTILNVAFYDHLFWDGRAESLEAQALSAIRSPSEMSMGLDNLEERIAGTGDYRRRFEQSFGDPQVTAQRIAKALATFERGITSRSSDFDRFLQGDRDAMTERQIHGLHVFRTKARCMNCHNGALLSDNQFHNLGQSHLGRPSQDLGRFLVTGDTADVGKFRTPSLRDITRTKPYFHHGLITDLREVINMYNQGMPQVIPKKEDDNPLLPEKSRLLKPLGLTEKEKGALLEFLRALSTRPPRPSVPALPDRQEPEP
jgi:cytochrome c peroxidase